MTRVHCNLFPDPFKPLFQDSASAPRWSLATAAAGRSRSIKLDLCGDSTPRYAIYQLQNLHYTVSRSGIVLILIMYLSTYRRSAPGTWTSSGSEC